MKVLSSKQFAAAQVFVLILCAFATVSFAGTIFLDADTSATGSQLATQSLVTAYGTITYQGLVVDRDSDPEFNRAGAAGNVFAIDTSTQHAQLFFNFDVSSVSFIYGGNAGSILVNALNSQGNIIASFYQQSTLDNQPAGPVELSRAGIRSIEWMDTYPNMTFAAIDNITITTVPEPSSIFALLCGMGGLGGIMWRRKSA